MDTRQQQIEAAAEFIAYGHMFDFMLGALKTALQAHASGQSAPDLEELQAGLRSFQAEFAALPPRLWLDPEDNRTANTAYRDRMQFLGARIAAVLYEVGGKA